MKVAIYCRISTEDQHLSKQELSTHTGLSRFYLPIQKNIRPQISRRRTRGTRRCPPFFLSDIYIIKDMATITPVAYKSGGGSIPGTQNYGNLFWYF